MGPLAAPAVANKQKAHFLSHRQMHQVSCDMVLKYESIHVQFVEGSINGKYGED